MSQLIVLSAVGTDRPGVVKDVSKAILDCGGNIEESRMTSLGAEFAVLMLISGNWHTPAKLEKALETLSKTHLPGSAGYRLPIVRIFRQPQHRDLRSCYTPVCRTAYRRTDVFGPDDRQYPGFAANRAIAR
jgi:glycine cleavage system transcriptional repressor